jgi:hypothetical protein
MLQRRKGTVARRHGRTHEKLFGGGGSCRSFELGAQVRLGTDTGGDLGPGQCLAGRGSWLHKKLVIWRKSSTHRRIRLVVVVVNAAAAAVVIIRLHRALGTAPALALPLELCERCRHMHCALFRMLMEGRRFPVQSG